MSNNTSFADAVQLRLEGDGVVMEADKKALQQKVATLSVNLRNEALERSKAEMKVNATEQSFVEMERAHEYASTQLAAQGAEMERLRRQLQQKTQEFTRDLVAAQAERDEAVRKQRATDVEVKVLKKRLDQGYFASKFEAYKKEKKDFGKLASVLVDEIGRENRARDAELLVKEKRVKARMQMLGVSDAELKDAKYLKGEMWALQREIEAMKGKLFASEQGKERLSGQLTKKTEEADGLKARLDEVEQMLGETKAERQELASRLGTLGPKHNTLVRRANTQFDTIKKAQEERDAAHQQMIDMKVQIQDMRKENEGLKHRIKLMERNLHNMENVKESYTMDLVKSVSYLADTKHANTQLQSDFETARGEWADKITELTEQLTELAPVPTKLKDTEEKLAAAVGRVRTLEKKSGELEMDRDQLDTENAVLREALEEQRKVADAQDRLETELQRRLSVQGVDLDRARQETALARAELEHAKGQMKKANDEVDGMKKAKAEAERQMESLNNRLEDTVETEAQFQRELARHIAARKQAEESAAKLASALEAITTDCKSLAEENDELRRKEATAQLVAERDEDRLRKEVEEHKRIHAEKDQLIDRMQLAIDTLARYGRSLSTSPPPPGRSGFGGNRSTSPAITPARPRREPADVLTHSDVGADSFEHDATRIPDCGTSARKGPREEAREHSESPAWGSPVPTAPGTPSASQARLGTVLRQLESDAASCSSRLAAVDARFGGFLGLRAKQVGEEPRDPAEALEHCERECCDLDELVLAMTEERVPDITRDLEDERRGPVTSELTERLAQVKRKLTALRRQLDPRLAVVRAKRKSASISGRSDAAS